ncbi:MAG: hypothetical protein WCK00_03345 [Deltaproteobacteria bacterium]
MHARINVGTLDADVQHRCLAGPRFVLYLDRVVAEADQKVCALEQCSLQLAHGPFDATQRQGMGQGS